MHQRSLAPHSAATAPLPRAVWRRFLAPGLVPFDMSGLAASGYPVTTDIFMSTAGQGAQGVGRGGRQRASVGVVEGTAHCSANWGEEDGSCDVGRSFFGLPTQLNMRRRTQHTAGTHTTHTMIYIHTSPLLLRPAVLLRRPDGPGGRRRLHGARAGPVLRRPRAKRPAFARRRARWEPVCAHRTLQYVATALPVMQCTAAAVHAAAGKPYCPACSDHAAADAIPLPPPPRRLPRAQRQQPTNGAVEPRPPQPAGRSLVRPLHVP